MANALQGGSRSFTQLLENAELQSPFDENCLKSVCEKAVKALDSSDLSGIE